jgi:very-short-patch-repair endonuclease
MQTAGRRLVWQDVSSAAARQHGLVTRAQLEVHYSRNQLARLVAQGLIVPCTRGVWRVPSAPQTWEQNLMLCCLAGGTSAAASHASAAVLWNLGFSSLTLDVTVSRHRSRRWALGIGEPGCPVTVHRRDLPSGEVVTRKHIPVTSAVRTLFDLAAVFDYELVARSVDNALRRRLVRVEQLRTARAGLVAPGVRTMDRIVAERDAAGVGDSEWEDRVWRWITAAGLPAPVRQHQVSLPSMAAVLDFAYPPYKVAVEFDGFASHHTRGRFDRDRVRNSELATAGWVLVIVTSTQAKAFAVRTVRRALESRGWQPAA